jgi:hypothetical protein
MWKILDARGAEYPAEHNVGHLYFRETDLEGSLQKSRSQQFIQSRHRAHLEMCSLEIGFPKIASRPGEAFLHAGFVRAWRDQPDGCSIFGCCCATGSRAPSLLVLICLPLKSSSDFFILDGDMRMIHQSQRDDEKQGNLHKVEREDGKIQPQKRRGEDTGALAWRGLLRRRPHWHIGYDKLHHADCRNSEHARPKKHAWHADRAIKHRPAARETMKVVPIIMPTRAIAYVRCRSRVASAIIAEIAAEIAPAPCIARPAIMSGKV